MHDLYTLQEPKSSKDWQDYHKIRIEQIHNRYCPDLVYNFDDPEEKGENNFPLVFRKLGSNHVLGVIRIDLLANNETSFRWIAIDPQFVRQGFGTKMLKMAEDIVRDKKCACIRIPATAESLGFSEKLGYMQKPWDLMPKEDCMIAVYKNLKET